MNRSAFRPASSPPARIVALLALAFLAVGTSSAAEGPGKHVALVIGNGDYSQIQSLRNPANDAEDMTASLARLGFSVISRSDADRKTMRSLIDDFATAIRGAEVALFYYSGHGVQVEGENYLVPVGAEVTIAADVPEECVPLSRVLARMVDSEAETNIVILDACRDNPFKAVTRGIDRGLAVIGRKPPESIIVYATAENEKAEDGTGRNGVFTSALLANLERDLPLADLLLDVKAQVRDATGDKQKPAVYENLTQKVYLSGKPAVPAAAIPAAATARDAEASPASMVVTTGPKPAASPWAPRSVGFSFGLAPPPIAVSSNLSDAHLFCLEGSLEYFPSGLPWLGFEFCSGYGQRSYYFPSNGSNETNYISENFLPLYLGPVLEYSPFFFLSLRTALLPGLLIKIEDAGDDYDLHFPAATFTLRASGGLRLNFTQAISFGADAVYTFYPPEKGLTEKGVSMLSIRILLVGHFIPPKAP